MKDIIDTYALAPHPEGGFYRETFRSPLRVQTVRGERAASTAIYYLLPGSTFSSFHRVLGADEVWHFYGGAPLELHLLSAGHSIVTLSRDNPQIVVPAGLWQAARSIGSYTFVGCTVAPGFEFSDFEIAARAALVAEFPGHSAIIEALTR